MLVLTAHNKMTIVPTIKQPLPTLPENNRSDGILGHYKQY